MTPKSLRIIQDLIGREMAKAFHTAQSDPKNARAQDYYSDLRKAEQELLAAAWPAKSQVD